MLKVLKTISMMMVVSTTLGMGMIKIYDKQLPIKLTMNSVINSVGNLSEYELELIHYEVKDFNESNKKFVIYNKNGEILAQKR